MNPSASESLNENDTNRSKGYAGTLERMGWLIIFLGMLTQVSSEYSFPSYNAILGFWATYCSLTKNGRAVFGLITFLSFSILLDIVYCSVYGPVGGSSSFKFALAMFVLCLLTKLPAIAISIQFFSTLGGVWSMELPVPMTGNMTTNADDNPYSTMPGYYHPPHNEASSKRGVSSHDYDNNSNIEQHHHQFPTTGTTSGGSRRGTTLTL